MLCVTQGILCVIFGCSGFLLFNRLLSKKFSPAAGCSSFIDSSLDLKLKYMLKSIKTTICAHSSIELNTTQCDIDDTCIYYT